MTLEDWVVREINLTFRGVSLLSRDAEREEFADRIGSDLAVETVPGDSFPSDSSMGTLVVTDDQFTVIEPRSEPVQIWVAADTTVVLMKEPRFSDLNRLSGLAHHAIDLAGQWPQMSSLHLHADYHQLEEEFAEKYLADRLFRGQRLGLDNWHLAGGDARVKFESKGKGHRRWNIEVIALPGDPYGCRVRQRAAMAVHELLPLSRSTYLRLLKEIWVGSQNFASRLDRVA